jgi:hypothetical protein
MEYYFAHRALPIAHLVPACIHLFHTEQSSSMVPDPLLGVNMLFWAMLKQIYLL